MADFADVSDLEAIWRELTDAEQVTAAARIAQASRLIRWQIPPVNGMTVDERIAAGTLDADLVADVVVEMVRRVMMLPGYIRQQSITVDDATKSQTFDSSVSSGAMFITEDERSMLVGRASGSRAFTIMPSAGRRWTPVVTSPWM